MFKKILPIILILIVIIVAATVFLYQKYFVVATVNGKSISRLRIITELEKQGGKKVLETIVTQELILQQAKKANITVSQKDIDDSLKTIEQNIAAQGSTLDEALKQQGMTKADLTEQIKLQVMVQKLVKADSIKITDKEVNKYINDNKELFPEDSKEKPDKNQIKEQLKQQKMQAEIEKFLTDIKNKAKITYSPVYK